MFTYTTQAPTVQELLTKLKDEALKMERSMGQAAGEPTHAPAHVLASVPAPADEELPIPESKTKEPVLPGITEVRAAMMAHRQKKGAPANMALLRAFGVERLPDLKPELYTALIEKAQEETNAAQ